MKSFLVQSWKAIAAGVGAGGAFYLTSQDWRGAVATALVVGSGVWFVPNKES